MAEKPISADRKPMYTSNTKLQQPKNTLQPLWRYITFDRLIEIIQHKSIYFSHISTMRDQLEGSLTPRTRAQLLEWNMRQNGGNISTANASVQMYEDHRKKYYINCWHINSFESYLMWRVYGNRECAIETTYERLVASFDATPENINGGVIRYVDFDRESIELGNSFVSVSHKDIR